MSLAEQAAVVDAVVEGEVTQLDIRLLEDDGAPLTQARLTVNRVFRGAILGGKLTLVLPGARVDGQYVGVLGFPEVAVGDTLLVFGDIMNSTEVQMLL